MNDRERYLRQENIESWVEVFAWIIVAILVFGGSIAGIVVCCISS